MESNTHREKLQREREFPFRRNPNSISTSNSIPERELVAVINLTYTNKKRCIKDGSSSKVKAKQNKKKSNKE